MAAGLTNEPLDWLLYSDVAVLIGLVTSYMPFMIFPLWLSLAGIDRRLVQASWMLGAPPARTFLRVTCRCRCPAVFAARDLRVRRLLRRKRHAGHHGRRRLSADRQQHHQRHGRAELPARRRDIDRRAGRHDGLLLVWYLAFDARAFLGKILAGRVADDMAHSDGSSGAAIGAVWLLYLPLVPPILFSVAPETAGGTAPTLRWYVGCGAIRCCLRHRDALEVARRSSRRRDAHPRPRRRDGDPRA